MRRLICCTVAFLLAGGAGLARAQTATLVLLNGKIWTENPGLPEAEAIAIEGPRILAVGSCASMRKLAGPNARIIDLQGRRVLPGFNDSHVHFLGGGSSANCRLYRPADRSGKPGKRAGGRRPCVQQPPDSPSGYGVALAGSAAPCRCTLAADGNTVGGIRPGTSGRRV
jgi:hypothetical protein